MAALPQARMNVRASEAQRIDSQRCRHRSAFADKVWRSVTDGSGRNDEGTFDWAVGGLGQEVGVRTSVVSGRRLVGEATPAVAKAVGAVAASAAMVA
ncbi:hypothetical protein PC121_g13186 [Phytophthora cactorum]|nr:hypothetical protein PC120_g23312 [Phytophthora cactorum]KAG3061045.1 hypothetical protein PC121_g13186 [Phytophthora cactorum]